MSDTDPWQPLIAELDRWQQHGKQAQFWLRDDDAVGPTAKLDQLLQLCERYTVPITLAVIPEKTDQDLARHLPGNCDVSVALHGWSHSNYAPPGEKKQELGLHRGLDVVLKQLRDGKEKLAGLYGDQFCNMLVPPWNRIAPEVIAHLPGLGLAGLSTFGPEQELPIKAINTHVDVIDWKGTRGGRDTAPLVAETVDRLNAVFDTGGTVGVLTHHLVHDDAVWAFLEKLFAKTVDQPGCVWVSVANLLTLKPKDQ